MYVKISFNITNKLPCKAKLHILLDCVVHIYIFLDNDKMCSHTYVGIIVNYDSSLALFCGHEYLHDYYGAF